MRHPDCYARLHNLWCQKYNTPFQWGQHDCIALALEAVEAMTGETLFPATARLPYNSYKSARRLLNKRSLLCRAEQALQQFETLQDDASLQSGDLAVVAMSKTTRQAKTLLPPHDTEEQNWIALAVLDLCPSGFVLPRIPTGITRIDKKHITVLKAWRIA